MLLALLGVLGITACAATPDSEDAEGAGGAMTQKPSDAAAKAAREKEIRKSWYEYTWEAAMYDEHPELEPVKSIYCEDDRHTNASQSVLFQQRKNGKWSIRGIHAPDGDNTSKDPNVITVNSYPWVALPSLKTCKKNGNQVYL